MNMNKVLLAANASILAVHLLVTLAESESRTGLVEVAAPARGGGALDGASSIAYVRLVHALEGSLPKEAAAALTADELRLLYDAVSRYRDSVSRGVARILGGADVETPLLRQHEELGRSAREEVEALLRSEFREDVLVRQIATAIIGYAG